MNINFLITLGVSMFWFDKRYNHLNHYYKNKFGEKVVKISVDGGFTCPNRDGTLSNRGCIFCSTSGSGDFLSKRSLTISQQFLEQKNLLSAKWNNAKFIVYFQSFTNTYGDIDELLLKYEEAISLENVVGISIATRPDCISNEVIDLLDKLSKKTYVQIELGLQTSNEKTAKLINRCYDNICFEEAVSRLKKINVDIVCHVIIGLPYETKIDMMNTIHFISKNKVNGVKLQLLHVLKNTELDEMYRSNMFDVLSFDEYVDILIDCIEILPENIVIHRLTGDGPQDILVAPLWSRNKKSVLNEVDKKLKLLSSWQGKKF